MTPDERAAKLMEGVAAIGLKAQNIKPDAPIIEHVMVSGYVPVLTQAIADAIYAAELEAEKRGAEKEREACANECNRGGLPCQIETAIRERGQTP